MGRRNSRGLELSFKPASGGRGKGRWYKKVGGRTLYFGWGGGVTDRRGYQDALATYRKWQAQIHALTEVRLRSVQVRKLQHGMSGLDDRPESVDLEAARERIAALNKLGGDAAEFVAAADEEEQRRIVQSLSTLSLARLRELAQVPAPAGKVQLASALLDQFLEAQRQRMERRRKLDGLRASGKVVQEGRRENLSPGRFARLATAVASFRACVEKQAWDGTEACAARVVKRFREWSDERLLADKISPSGFNENVQCARHFVGWAESNYVLDRIPRDKKLFAKYQIAPSAKSIPVAQLRKLWKHADDRGRAFLLLGLNCAYYAVDISDLKVDQVVDGYLRHRRGKTGVVVSYRLWPETRKYLKRAMAGSGTAFPGANGRPLVYHVDGDDGVPVRVDNVKNWWGRLCRTAGVPLGKKGFSFSNVRDTATSEVEKIDKAHTDLFAAHVDKRMARFYIDGQHTDTSALDKVIDELERRLNIWETPAVRRGK